MSLQNPVVAYTAATNVEAHLLSAMLEDAGVPAVAVDDVSQVGNWMGGIASQIHKPQVWVEKADRDRARTLLMEYEQRNAERRAAEARVIDDRSTLRVTCESCGRQVEYPGSKRNTIQTCPHCQTFVDVGEVVADADWDESTES